MPGSALGQTPGTEGERENYCPVHSRQQAGAASTPPPPRPMLLPHTCTHARVSFSIRQKTYCGLQWRARSWADSREQNLTFHKASVHVLTHWLIRGGRTEALRKGKPREAGQLPQARALRSRPTWHCTGESPCCGRTRDTANSALEAHPAHSQRLTPPVGGSGIPPWEPRQPSRLLGYAMAGAGKSREEDFGEMWSYILNAPVSSHSKAARGEFFSHANQR